MDCIEVLADRKRRYPQTALASRLHVPDKRGERDALIAATALVHGMTVVTRNVADIEPTGVAVIDPWQKAASRARRSSH